MAARCKIEKSLRLKSNITNGLSTWIMTRIVQTCAQAIVPGFGQSQLSSMLCSGLHAKRITL